MKIILLDDEVFALDELEYCLKKYKELEIVAKYNDSVRFLNDFRSMDFDVAFLDIDMPYVNGLNVARELMEYNNRIRVVFVTAFEKYAVKAFDLSAIDYILKPVEKERLDMTVNKLLKTLNQSTGMRKTIIEKLNNIEKNIKQDSERLSVYSEDEVFLVKMSEVICIEAENGKTILTTKSGKYTIRETLDSMENKLNNFGFFRCHRSYIINLRYVNKISPMFNNNFVLKQEGIPNEIPVSRNQIKNLKKCLGIELH